MTMHRKKMCSKNHGTSQEGNIDKLQRINPVEFLMIRGPVLSEIPDIARRPKKKDESRCYG